MKMFTAIILSIVVTSVCNAQSNNESREAICILGSDLHHRDQEIVDLNAIVRYLESQNYKVHKFFNETNDWEAIKKASLNASIFIYRGHGTLLGIDEGFGGIVIGDFISAQKIASELKFAKNPIVLFPFFYFQFRLSLIFSCSLHYLVNVIKLFFNFNFSYTNN